VDGFEGDQRLKERLVLVNCFVVLSMMLSAKSKGSSFVKDAFGFKFFPSLLLISQRLKGKRPLKVIASTESKAKVFSLLRAMEAFPLLL